MFHQILANKKAVLLAFVLITLFLAPFAAKVTPDNSVESLGVRGDPAIDLMRKMEKIFGSEEFISVSFETKDILDHQTLQLVENITTEIETIPQIATVMSLTRVPTLRESPDGVFHVEKLITEEWLQTGVPESERQKVLNKEIAEHLFFNKEGTATSIMAQFKPLGSDDATRDKILSQFEKITDKYQAQTGIHFHVLGMPVLNRLNFGVVEHEQNFTNGLLMLVVALTFWLMYRRLSLVLIPLGLLGLVMVWVMGTIGLVGARFNWMLAVAPAVIVIVSICNSIHVINAYRARSDLQKTDRIKHVIATLGLPCFFTMLTDFIGFFSISSSRIYALRDFGIYVGLGSLYAFVATLFLLPIFLTYLKDREKRSGARKYEEWARKILSSVLDLNIKYKKRVLAVSLIVLGLLIAGISRVKIDTEVFGSFKWGADEIIQANRFAFDKVGAGTEFYFLFDSSRPDYFLEPQNLKILEKIQKRLITEVNDVTVKTVGLPDIVKTINQSVHGDDDNYYKIPDSKEEVGQLLFLVASNGNELSTLATKDYSLTRIRFFSIMADTTAKTLKAIEKARKILDEEVPAGVTHELSGRPLIMCDTLNYILSSQITSFGLACLLIFAALTFLFRSLKLGLICMIPNILPILATLGIMGWWGIGLDAAASMVASTVIGIAVDDTIHFMWGIKKMVSAGASYEEALRQVFDEAGLSAFSATFVVVSGFMVFGISQLWPVTYFGILTAISCTLALVTELFLTPTLLLILKPIKVKQVSLDNLIFTKMEKTYD